MTVKTPVILEVGAREKGFEKRSEPISEPERPLRNVHEPEFDERDKGFVPKSSTH